jgi:ferrochelatase
MPETSAILLLAHGTPNVLGEMAEYLAKVTNGRPMPAQIVEELQHRYAEIGLADAPLAGGPPLTRWTLRQGELLGEAEGTKVYVGMRNWHPYIADVVTQMKLDGVTHARVLCLAPQNSRTSTGLYRRALEAALEIEGRPFTFDYIAGWADEPRLAQSFAEKLWPVWAEACARASLAAGKDVHVPVLFTAHSVPCRTILVGAAKAASSATPAADGIQSYGESPTPDPYPVECKQLGCRRASGFLRFNRRGSPARRGSGRRWRRPCGRSRKKATPQSCYNPSGSCATTSRFFTTSTLRSNKLLPSLG